jgi:hypothetical protein
MGGFYWSLRILTRGVRVPRYAPNRMSPDVKRRYFELVRTGMRGARAAAEVGVSLSCGSVRFIDAGSVSYVETPISGRYFSQDDRIEIADGLARGERVKGDAGHPRRGCADRLVPGERSAAGEESPRTVKNGSMLASRRRLQLGPAIR